MELFVFQNWRFTTHKSNDGLVSRIGERQSYLTTGNESNPLWNNSLASFTKYTNQDIHRQPYSLQLPTTRFWSKERVKFTQTQDRNSVGKETSLDPKRSLHPIKVKLGGSFQSKFQLYRKILETIRGTARLGVARRFAFGNQKTRSHHNRSFLNRIKQGGTSCKTQGCKQVPSIKRCVGKLGSSRGRRTRICLSAAKHDTSVSVAPNSMEAKGNSNFANMVQCKLVEHGQLDQSSGNSMGYSSGQVENSISQSRSVSKQEMEIRSASLGWEAVSRIYKEVIQDRLATSTQKIYQKWINTFELFCQIEKQDMKELSEEFMIKFLATMFVCGKGHSIQTIIAACKHWYKVQWWPYKVLEAQSVVTFAESLQLFYNRHFKKELKRDPFDIDILRYWKKSKNFVESQFASVQWLVLLLVGLRCALRPGEISLLTVGSVVVKPNLVTIDCKRLKSGSNVKKQKNKVPIERTMESDLCVVYWMPKYLVLLKDWAAKNNVMYGKGIPLFPIWSKSTGVVGITGKGIQQIIDNMQQVAQLVDPSLGELNLKPHSIRIGAATAMAAMGVDISVIKAIGNWSEGSETVLRYIRSFAGVAAKVSTRLFGSLAD